MEKCVELEKCRKLNKNLTLNYYTFKGNPSDVASIENRTFICSGKKKDAKPANIECN